MTEGNYTETYSGESHYINQWKDLVKLRFSTRAGESTLPAKFAIQEGFSRLSLNLFTQGSSLEEKTKKTN